MSVMKQLSIRSESGAASMIIVMFMALILTIMTVGFIQIAINEQRDATDDDLTNRAFYAAESGIEDARRALQADIAGTGIDLKEDECAPPDGYVSELSSFAEFDTEYSCMLIDRTPNTIRTQVASPNATKQYEVVPSNPNTSGSEVISAIRLEWHIDEVAGSAGDGLVDSGGPLTLRGNSDRTIPQQTSWDHPAMMRVTFITYPGNRAFDRSEIESTTVHLSPARVGGASATPFIGNAASPLADGQIFPADCVYDVSDRAAADQSEYACRMDFNMGSINTNNQKLEVRITNLYRGTNMELRMANPAGDNLNFENAQAVVDVTGRAGGVYRRVEAIFDLTTQELLPDYAIQTAGDLCKDFSFTNNAADYQSRCPLY